MNYIHQLKKVFNQAHIGHLAVETPQGEVVQFEGQQPGLVCDLKIKHWSAMDMIFKRGDIGFGEGYHLGLWDTSNLSDLLTYCSHNIQKLKHAANGNGLSRLKFYIYNRWIKMNTKYGSKKNIVSHYDISNAFYALWLDPTMTYSSALREHPSDSLEQAQINKYNRILNRLGAEKQKILEIGCGWGGFAQQAIQRGAQLTGITISDQQYAFAKKKLGQAAEILLQDYRDIKAKFDHIVSIEMFEAVGEKYWSAYFNQIKQSLKKGGKALIQTITIQDDAFADYRKNSDYIRQHIFPGGMLPSKKIFQDYAWKAQLKVTDIFEFGQDYAWTLRQWLHHFSQHQEALLHMGYSKHFLRAWEFYLSLSIAGFASGRTNVMQAELMHH